MSVANSLAHVFLVEDSYGDIVLTKAILKAKKIKLKLSVFRDGVDVIDQLENCRDDKLPDLILLDFNLPKVDGLGVMKYLNEESWDHIPVFVVSGSDAPGDKKIMQELGARTYLQKPLDSAQLTDAIKPLENIFLTPVEDELQLLRA